MAASDWEKELADIDRRLASIPDAPTGGPADARRGAPSPNAPRAPGGWSSLPEAPSPGARAPQPVAPPSPRAPLAPDSARHGVSGNDPAAAPRGWRTRLVLLLRLVLGLAVVAALVLWPYPTRCGVELGYYLAGVGVLALAGMTTMSSAWRHRAPLVHLAGLLMLASAAVLGAREILPKTGYAYPTPEHPVAWSCS